MSSFKNLGTSFSVYGTFGQELKWFCWFSFFLRIIMNFMVMSPFLYNVSWFLLSSNRLKIHLETWWLDWKGLRKHENDNLFNFLLWKFMLLLYYRAIFFQTLRSTFFSQLKQLKCLDNKIWTIHIYLLTKTI